MGGGGGGVRVVVSKKRRIEVFLQKFTKNILEGGGRVRGGSGWWVRVDVSREVKIIFFYFFFLGGGGGSGPGGGVRMDVNKELMIFVKIHKKKKKKFEGGGPVRVVRVDVNREVFCENSK